MEEPKTITEPVQSQVQNNEPTTTEPVQAQVQNNEPQTNTNEDKTSWQEKTNEIVKKEKSKAKQSLLKDLGFEDLEQAKNSIEEFKAFKESQKTEEEKRQEEVNALKEENERLKQQRENLELQNKLAQLNVPQEKMEDALLFASQIKGSEDFETRITNIFGTKVEKQSVTVVPPKKEEPQKEERRRTSFDAMLAKFS